MAQNVGKFDRTLRIALGSLSFIIGAVVLLEFLAWGRTVGAVLAGVGIVLLGTGFNRQCLLYRPLGIDTSK